MTLDLPGGRRLILAGGGLGLFWVGVGGAAVVLLLVLFRAERALVSRRVGLTLLGLRLLAAAVLVMALFEPIAARTFRETLRGRVIVAVDVSESMSTADPDRSGPERVALVKTLGLSMGDPIDAMSRRELARKLIAGPLKSLANDHDVQALAFARDTAPGSLESIAETLKTPPKPGDPAAQTTDWEPALREALKSPDKSAPVVGVVLITDGRRNAESDAGPTVDRLAARGIPIFPVLTGTTRPPIDAAIASVKAPESVYQGDVATIEATLKLDGFPGRPVTVRLDRPQADPIRQTITAPSNGARPSVSFRLPMEVVGNIPITLAIEPMDGDVRPDNNARNLTIQVADDKAKVLLVDGEARWEFRYLRNALARDPRVTVEAVVFHQPSVGIVADSIFTYGTLLPTREAASAASANGTNPDPLGAFDMIIVGDVDPSDMSAEAWARIESFVAERGGTLVLCAGPRFAAALAALEPVRKLLPVLSPKVVNVDDAGLDDAHPALPPGARFTPVDSALQDPNAWPMLQLAADPEESRRRWRSLPGLPWVMAGKAKPGASALATSGDDPNAVILAAQPYGLGKVFWVGTDGTWRWRHRVGDAYHHRFWGQVVRWASSGKLAAGNAFVRFGPRKPHAAEGESVPIQARISEGVPGVLPDLLIAARVFASGASEALAVVPLRPAAGQPRTYEGMIPPLTMGAYVIKLDVPGLTDALQLKPPAPAPEPFAALEIVARDGSERVELSAARDPLDRLATATSGKVLPDYEADALPPLLHARVKQAVRTEETPLWDQPAALILFFSIITIEWVMRKRVGLP